MQPDRCLHVCLVGDTGIGTSSFLRAYRESEGGAQPDAQIESIIACVELDNEPYCVRFTDNAGSPYFESLQSAALSTAHVVLVCFSMDSPRSFQHAKDKWFPRFWSMASEAPTYLIGLRSDLCAKAGALVVDEAEASELAPRHGALAFLECSSEFPETVRRVVDEVLPAAKEYYGLQWQLQPEVEPSECELERHPVTEAREETQAVPWVTHERLNITEDPRALDEATASKNLSVLGVTPTQKHAFLRLDIPDLGLTSLDAVRRYKHLQFVNVSKNHLRSLEPLGALHCLLHLNASYNLLIRTQSFAAPESLETVDMSYNMIGTLGEWGVHKYLRELNLRGNFISKIGPGLRRNAELRMLDLSENHIPRIENLDGLGLRTLFLAQNQLTSLEGVGTLQKLQVLNVRHNNITSMAAFRAEDIPRLRKLFVSENRISHIKEIEGLQSFRFLCDLVLVPNPVVKLPHYRAQVIHRLPQLRMLDSQTVPAEEKVKADLIYGSDVEERQQIFVQLLPEESFVDRRLVTEEGVAELELEQFGQQGDAGRYGFALSEQREAEQNTQRTVLQDAKLRQRLEQARRGGVPTGVCDLAAFAAPFAQVTVCDEDLTEVLEAVAEGGVTQLLLGAAPLSAEGVRDILDFLYEAPHLRYVDLTGCAAVGEIGMEIVNGFPYSRGCSLNADGCGLSAKHVERLLNRTPGAEEALRRIEQERKRTEDMIAAYLSRQEAYEAVAAENCAQASAPVPPYRLCHPAKWLDGIEGPSQAALRAFRAANPSGMTANGNEDMEEDWSLVCKDGSTREISVELRAALVLQRDAMLEEWRSQTDPNAERDGGDNGLSQHDSRNGRPLPKAFADAFENVPEDILLGFMLWEGFEPSQEMLSRARSQIRQRREAAARRDREEWEAVWKLRQEKMQALTAAARKLYDVSTRDAGFENGQIMAHFAYLCLGGELTGNDALKPFSYFGLKRFSQAQPETPRRGHDLRELVAGGEVVIEAAVGTRFSLRLAIRNTEPESLEIMVRRGTIFQHVDWVHRQNLMVCVEYSIMVPPGQTVARELRMYCMNLSCACSSGNRMALTDFYFDDVDVLASQGLVWDHFQRCFSK